MDDHLTDSIGERATMKKSHTAIWAALSLGAISPIVTRANAAEPGCAGHH
ncbi:MAG TPA: hypothetical protein VF749_08955 [Candidatus Acidoferrum sp.]